MKKGILLRTDIAAVIMSAASTVVFAIKGTNPPVLFAGLFGLPITLLVIANNGTSQILKKKTDVLYAELKVQRK